MGEDFLNASLGIDFDGAALITTSGPIVVRLCGLSLLSFLASRIVKRAVRNIDDARTRRQLDFFAPKTVRIVVVAVGLEVAGIDVTGMAAILATVGFTGAVVFTPLGQNIVAGVVTTLDDIYDVGDVIEVDGTWGTVLSRSLLRIELGRPDGTTVWIPNAVVSERMTLNHSRMGGYRIEIDIPLDHNPDRDLAREVMNDVVRHWPWELPERPPTICFDEVAGDATIFKVYAWIADRSTEPMHRSALLTALVNALEAAGLSVGHTTNLSAHGTLGSGTPH